MGTAAYRRVWRECQQRDAVWRIVGRPQCAFALLLTAVPGLFHKGIVQSAYSLPDVTRDAAREKGVMVATALGLPADASMAQLRELPADAFWPLDSSLGLGPVAIAGDMVLPEPVLKTLMAGKQHRLPLMAGSNSDEASVLVWFGVEAAAVVGQLRRNNHFHYRLLRWIYRTGDDALLGRAVARDMTFSIVPG